MEANFCRLCIRLNRSMALSRRRKGKWEPHIQHNCKLDDLWTGFEITEEYKIGHGPDANIQHAVGQDSLF